MKTYLTIYFDSEGASPSDIAARLNMLGFQPTQGNYDFEYEWSERATVKEAVWFADKVHHTLSGLKVLFKIETI